MPKITFTVALIFSLLWPLTLVLGADDKWQLADQMTVRLAPSEFHQLPKNIIRNLQARQCTIPQSFIIAKPHNVISGEFSKRGQIDWAILCSRAGISSILVFWGGFDTSVAEISRAPDRDFLQVIDGEGRIGFSRVLNGVDRKYILDRYKNYGGPKPPPIKHQGINDAFAEKASVVHYFYRGKWVELQGAD